MENKTNTTPPKVVIAVPCADASFMKARTAASIAHTIIESEGKVVDMLLRISCDIVSSRTWLVLEAIKQEATHILFVDSDMVFPANTLNQLLSHEKDIVGVQYNKREFPPKGVYAPLDEKSETELYRAKHVGTGMLLIDLKVFANIGHPSESHPKGNPWFSFGRDSQGALVLGEDVWFCNVARDAGYDVWIDPTLKIGHAGEYVY
jgi:hypothetical protein